MNEEINILQLFVIIALILNVILHFTTPGSNIPMAVVACGYIIEEIKTHIG
jgi:hypothetical protein